MVVVTFLGPSAKIEYYLGPGDSKRYEDITIVVDECLFLTFNIHQHLICFSPIKDHGKTYNYTRHPPVNKKDSYYCSEGPLRWMEFDFSKEALKLFARGGVGEARSRGRGRSDRSAAAVFARALEVRLVEVPSLVADDFEEFGRDSHDEQRKNDRFFAVAPPMLPLSCLIRRLPI